VLLVLIVGVVAPAAVAAADHPVVRGVLFFSPTCPHCHTVIDEVLPGLFTDNGGSGELFYDETLPREETASYLITNGRLEILLADVTVPDGSELFSAATEAFGIGSPVGVPLLVVGDQVMIGSEEIPERFPAIIADTLSSDVTIDWPEIPGIEVAVAATGAPSTTVTAPSLEEDTSVAEDGGVALPVGEDPSMWDRFGRDPAGNSVSVLVLVVMVSGLIGAVVRFRSAEGSTTTSNWLVPVLAVAGLVVASYLAFVEVGGVEAVCGPVGDCNTVQQSDYARLFGVIPIGVIGVAGYLAMIAAWVTARFAGPPVADWAAVTLAAAAVAGTVLSVYLTFLEPFVIGATCMWCITSAVLVTLVMWLYVHPARRSFDRLRPAG